MNAHRDLFSQFSKINLLENFRLAYLKVKPSMMTPKSRKRDQKIKKNSADFQFFQFSFVASLSHWYQDWVKVNLACFQEC